MIEVNPAGEDFANSNQRKMPLTILKNVNDGMAAMQEEIFGPVLPVMTYKAVDQAVDYINEHDRPSASITSVRKRRNRSACSPARSRVG